MTSPQPTQTDLSQQLLRRLASLSAPAGVSGPSPHGGTVFGHCVFAREEVRQMRMEHPALVVVLSGVKELWSGETCERMPTGVPFVMSAGTVFDVVNIPDPRSGRYESLCISVDPDLRRATRDLAGPTAIAPAGEGRALLLTPDLVEAYGHAAAALTDPRLAPALARHRVLEILLLARASPAARPLFAATLTERAEAALRSDPSRDWRVEDLARELALGASTLRRQLGLAGTSFRELLLAARMSVAGDLLASPAYSVAQAAQATGYRSRSHFARRFRAAHGATPREARG